MRLYLLFIFLAISSVLSAQKKMLIEDYDKVTAQAARELDEAMKGPEGELYQFKTENEITGIYDFDITVHEKGEVATVFARDREGGSIQMQNQLKDYVKELTFNFKMPKGKDYKFNYKFNFNSN